MRKLTYIIAFLLVCSITYASSLTDSITIEEDDITSATTDIGFGGENLITTGNITIDGDSKKVWFGDGQDASVYYDGFDLVLKPDVVGTGSVTIGGNWNLPTFGGGSGDVLVMDSDNHQSSFKTVTVDIPIVFTLFDAVPARNSESNWNGALLSLSDADTLSNGDNITVEKGIGKMLLVVVASNDAIGDITVTGDTVNRDTGVVSIGDTDTITLAGDTTDNTTTDSNGNLVHKFVGAYITSKWFTGEVVLSTTEVDLTDVDVYHVSFEQFNDQASITLDTFDANIFTSNANAEFDAYLFDLHLSTGDKCNVENHAELHVGADGETAIADVYWRLRQSNINQALDGTTDGIWVDVHYGGIPASTEDVTIKVWATRSQTLTLN